MDKIIDEANNRRFKKCLENLYYLNELKDHELEAIQEICHRKMGEFRGMAWEAYKDKYVVGEKIAFFGIHGAVNKIILDPEFNKELPADYFKIESLSKKIKKRLEDQFPPLFKKPEHADQVKKILESNEYTIDGKWKGMSEQKNELLAAYHALKPIMNPGLPTTQAKIFYSTFGLKVGKDSTLKGEYITDRQLRIDPLYSDIEKFEIIFKEILLKTEKSENSLN
jgi:hypothetical protein